MKLASESMTLSEAFLCGLKFHFHSHKEHFIYFNSHLPTIKVDQASDNTKLLKFSKQTIGNL